MRLSVSVTWWRNLPCMSNAQMVPSEWSICLGRLSCNLAIFQHLHHIRHFPKLGSEPRRHRGGFASFGVPLRGLAASKKIFSLKRIPRCVGIISFSAVIVHFGFD